MRITQRSNVCLGYAIYDRYNDNIDNGHRILMSFPKSKRMENRKYLNWVATHKCAACGIHDETIVPHHLKHIYQQLSGGTGYKASDWLTMPLCFSCHDKIHNGSRWLIEYQPFMILSTVDNAFREGIIRFSTPSELKKHYE